MAYEKYKKELAREEFFANWDTKESLPKTKEEEDAAYNRYLFRVFIINRDNYTCQNLECKYCHNEKEYHNLQIHRIKAGRNGGEYKPRNCVLICGPSHKHFNRCKDSLTFEDTENLPAHIRRHTFWQHKEEEINWKEIKAESSRLKKGIKDSLPEYIKQMPIGKRAWFALEFGQLAILFMWVFVPMYNIEEEYARY